MAAAKFKSSIELNVLIGQEGLSSFGNASLLTCVFPSQVGNLRYISTGKLYLGPRRPRQLTRYFRGKVPESWLVGGSQGILVTAI